MKSNDNFIWDFDGTLFDTYPFTVECFCRGIKDLGFAADPKHVYLLMMDVIPKAFEFYMDKFSLGQELYDSYWKYASAESCATSGPFPLAKEICMHIKESGGKNFIFTHRSSDVYPFLEGYGFTDLFDDIITREHGFPDKPHPGGVLHLLEKHALPYKNTVFVGDRMIDIQSGANANIVTCHITNEVNPTDFPADYRFENLEQLFKAITEEI